MLSGSFPVSDPLNTSATTFLIGSFYTLGDDGRAIFREALTDLLERSSQGDSLALSELSSALFVSFEIELFRRHSYASRRALLSLLNSAIDAGEEERISLVVKYLSASRLIIRLDEWQHIYRRCGADHFLSCFTGMAQLSMPEALYFLLEVGGGGEFEMVADYAIPALMQLDGGVDRVRTSLQTVRADIAPVQFDVLAQGFARAMGVPEANLERWMLHGLSAHESQYSGTGEDMDAELAILVAQWDDAMDTTPIPAQVVSAYGLDE